MKTVKVVINVCYGGFGLSDEACERYFELKGMKMYKNKDSLGSSYTSVPYEEYQAIYEEELKKPVSHGRFEKSNELYWTYYDIDRSDPVLVQVVEELGKKSWGRCAELKVVEIPEGVEWQIKEYDGLEHVAEKHRTWS